jgi:hypothetical protein
MEDRQTMSVYKSDKERLKKYFEPGKTWADALKNALDKLDGVKDA